MTWQRASYAVLVLTLMVSSARADGAVMTSLMSGVDLALPAGLSIVPMQGMDSTVRKITGEGVSCIADLGAAADPLNADGGQITELTISGRPARLLRRDPDLDAVHIAEVGNGPVGPTGLTVYCKTEQADRRDDIRKMLLSISID